jgi:hypothetical protein
MTENDTIKLETKISDILPDRTSSNNTPYCALVLPSGDWVFVWEGHWKNEIETHIDQYRDLNAEIYVIDKEDDPDDHFYNLKAVTPQSEAEAQRFLQRNMAEDNYDGTEPDQPDIPREAMQTL